jgi:hypothetical protein
MINKAPLSLSVITHKKFEEREEFNEIIYSTFCKDLEDWLNRGINIPIFFYDSNNIHIDKNSYEKNIVVILIDDKLILDKKNNDLNPITSDDELYIVSFAISKNAYKLSSYFTEQNLIRLYDLKNRLDTMVLNLAHFICKCLTDKQQKVFISHAKLDGNSIAKDLQHYISTETKLDSFFDAHNIQESTEWKNELEDNIKNSIVLVYYTDLYSTRLWCRKEILFAKKYDRPIVVVNLLKKREDRSFPYMANVPIVKVEDFSAENYLLILKSLLVETVRYYYHHNILEEFVAINKLETDFTPIAFTPELLTLINKKKCENFLYPDPPIGLEEIEILNSYKSERYYTPLTYLNKNSQKRDLKVAISISESQDIGEYGVRLYHLRSLIVELARYFLAFDMQLMYGGDIRYDKQFNFAEIIAQLVQSYNQEYTQDAVVTNYSSYPYYKKINDALKTDLLDIVDFIEIKPDEKYNINSLDELEQSYIIAQTLTKMREEMTKTMNIKVVAGGKSENFSGKYPGVLEEAYLALKSEIPIYLIGGFGGVSKKIVDLLNGNTPKEFCVEYQSKNSSFKTLYEYYKDKGEKDEINYERINSLFVEKGIDGFNNGLNAEENKKLFESKNIYEIIYLIFKGIQKSKEKAIN